MDREINREGGNSERGRGRGIEEKLKRNGRVRVTAFASEYVSEREKKETKRERRVEKKGGN